MIVFLMVFPFFLNDFFLHIFDQDYYKFISVFYLTGIFAMVMAWSAVRRSVLSSGDLGLLPIRAKYFFLFSLGLIFVCILSDRVFVPWTYHHLIDVKWSYYNFPAYPNQFLRWFDLTLGLALTAVSEEIVFRGALLTVLCRRFSRFNSGLISMIIFSTMHWGAGPQTVLNAFIWAILPTFFALRYRSIYPLILAHFATDFVSFALF